MTVFGFKSEEAFLRYTKRECKSGHCKLSTGETLVLLEIIERLRGKEIKENASG